MRVASESDKVTPLVMEDAAGASLGDRGARGARKSADYGAEGHRFKGRRGSASLLRLEQGRAEGAHGGLLGASAPLSAPLAAALAGRLAAAGLALAATAAGRLPLLPRLVVQTHGEADARPGNIDAHHLDPDDIAGLDHRARVLDEAVGERRDMY